MGQHLLCGGPPELVLRDLGLVRTLPVVEVEAAVIPERSDRGPVGEDLGEAGGVEDGAQAHPVFGSSGSSTSVLPLARMPVESPTAQTAPG